MGGRTGRLKAVVAGWKWGSNHMRANAESEVRDLVAIWSRTANPGAKDLAQLYNVPFCTDFERILGEMQPDIASVAVPKSAHESLTLTALEAGCHVYCEKVLSDSRIAAQRMVQSAQAEDRLLNIGCNYRYSPSCVYVALPMKEGRIGKPLFAHLRAFGLCLHHMTDYANSLFGKPARVVAVIDWSPVLPRADIRNSGAEQPLGHGRCRSYC